MTQEQSLEMIAWCQLACAIGAVGFLIALIYLIASIRKTIDTKINEAMSKIEPIVTQAKAVAEQTRETVETIGTKVDSIANKAESTASKVGDTVQLLSGKVDQAVTPKVAATIGLAGAAIKLVELYGAVSRIRKSRDKEK